MPDDGPDSRLEPAYQAPFAAWHATRTPAAAGGMLRALAPTIAKGVRAYGGPHASPTLKAHAKSITLRALATYDPARAPLESHVLRHLQGLQRPAAREGRLLSVPDRVVMDRQRLDRGEATLRDELGREPTTAELADHLMLPPARIALVRTYRPGVAQSRSEAAGDAAEGGYEAAVAGPDPTHARAEFLMGDLDPTDRLILEHGLGMHGRPRLGTGEIARRLGLSPGRVSQRAARVQGLLDRVGDLGVA